MGVEKYSEQLSEIEAKFNAYKQNIEAILETTTSAIHHTVITKGEILNPTPYYYERMGSRLNGKIIPMPIISDDCMKYHYDNENRIIMIEEYSTFLKKFNITEVYFYNEQTERLRLSSGYLAVLSVFGNTFSDVQLCLAFAGRNGYVVEEFAYDEGVLNEIKISRSDTSEIHRFIYEGQKLIQIERICENGYKALLYTTKKPDFKQIRENVLHSLKELITLHKGAFASVGIEGFLDQQQPMFCVCFSGDNQPSDLIADWKVEMHEVYVYDWQLNDAQEKKCVKIIAELLVELVKEGLLKDKQIYFHQNQVCVTQHYAGAKSLFKKENISVK